MKDQDFAETVNALNDGWNRAMGVRFVRATLEEVIAELEVGAMHRQPLGLVHGGVYAGMIESVASVGAALHAMRDGKLVVGLENHTSFLRGVREGTLRAIARPLSCGRRTHVWEATIEDGGGRAAATGRVRLLVIEGDFQTGG